MNLDNLLLLLVILSPGWGLLLYYWLKKRALIRMAKTYGIEYVPGEDLTRLCAWVVAKRDEVIK
jgi:hypothetical protein